MPFFNPKTFIDIIVSYLDSKPDVKQAFSQNLFLFPTKLHLDISVDGLKIIVPLLKSPKNALVFDCEELKFKTTLEFLNNYYEEKVKHSEINPVKLSHRCHLTPIIENHNIFIQSMTVSRYFLKKRTSLITIS